MVRTSSTWTLARQGRVLTSAAFLLVACGGGERLGDSGPDSEPGTTQLPEPTYAGTRQAVGTGACLASVLVPDGWNRYPSGKGTQLDDQNQGAGIAVKVDERDESDTLQQRADTLLDTTVAGWLSDDGGRFGKIGDLDGWVATGREENPVTDGSWTMIAVTLTDTCSITFSGTEESGDPTSEDLVMQVVASFEVAPG